MKPTPENDDPVAERWRGLGTTHWPLIRQAGGGPDAREALATLCRWYWHPIEAFYRRIGTGPLDPSDLTQGLFQALLARDDLARLDPRLGRFRPWLHQCARFYLYNCLDKLKPWERHGGLTRLTPAGADGGDRALSELEDPKPLDPDPLLDRDWALTVVDRALTRLEENYVHPGNRLYLDELLHGLAGHKPGLTDAAQAAALGQPEGNIRKNRSVMRKKFRHYVRQEVAQLVPDPDDIDDELRYLIAALGS